MIGIDTHRIAEEINCLARFGAHPGGGVTRLLYDESWLAAQRYLAGRMESAGLRVRYDEVGNLYGTLEGTDRSLRPVLTGSHVDTVVQGGMYDGAYGIVAGILALEALQARYGRPRRSLEVVSLCEEEGSRFPTVFWGSEYAAAYDEPERNAERFGAAESLYDAKGLTLAEAMASCGFGPNGDYVTGLERRGRREAPYAFIELHIEQGGVLEAEGRSIGIVTSIVGQIRAVVAVEGCANHAGTTPMKLRKDALTAACEMILWLEERARRSEEGLVATVGSLRTLPGVGNVIPGRVEFTVDIRHSARDALHRFAVETATGFNRIAADRGVVVSWQESLSVAPVPMDSGLVRKWEAVCRDEGVDYRLMSSGAGHDAMIFARVCPAAMLFVPSRDGISHHPDEYTDAGQLALGACLLAETMYRMGYKVEEDSNETI
ncbi:Zn-dependent hydrolase [Paenibacillus turpanensis]|uniref:Zn-dependent hydrolase n=1 Tax=Paenibacillus turpanensis TaxID=2689078 RepID=UPI001407688A|nr:Zn-dependent hydrolase [Paenibacillus turpanensis]